MTWNILIPIFLIAFSFFTAAISAVTGMGGGIILLSVMTLFYPLNIVIPLHGFIQFISNLYRSYLLRNHITWSLAVPFFMGAPLGTFLSYLIIKMMPSPLYPQLIITFIIFYSVFRPKSLPSLNIPNWGFFFLGVIVGLFSLIIGATGPIIAPFFLRSDLKKENLIATKAAVQTMGHVLKIPAFIALSFPFENYAWFIFFMTLFTILGTKWGIKILFKVNETLFIKIFKIGLFLTGVRMTFKIIFE
tara:strand:- start:1772 stop:2509 length:738 start_codon:yes stop_codon:yes gene_type:complete